MPSTVKPSSLSTITTLKKASERSFALPLLGTLRITFIVSAGILASSAVPDEIGAEPPPLGLGGSGAAGKARSMSSGVHSTAGSSAIIRALAVGAASLLSAAAQDSTMGAPPGSSGGRRFDTQRIDRA